MRATHAAGHAVEHGGAPPFRAGSGGAVHQPADLGRTPARPDHARRLAEERGPARSLAGHQARAGR